jgi:prepilin-type N-terminal cleavage/methylation domain-containing protein
MDSQQLQVQRGFTLIEVVIVIAMMSILAAITVLRWPGSNINIGAEARQLANTIRYTQALAMSTNQRYHFYRASATTYQIRNASSTPIALPNGVTTGTLGSGITFGTFTNLPNNLVAFGGNGAPLTDLGSTALATTATIPITNGTITQTITITPATGRVIVQ